MNTTIQLLDSVKIKHGLASDYALAKKLGVSQPAVTKYRVHGQTMDDRACLKVAELLEIDAATVLACVHAERAKTEAEKTAWKLIYERLGGIAASVLIATLLSAAPSAPAKADSRNVSHTVYYVKQEAQVKSQSFLGNIRPFSNRRIKSPVS